jgi:hypothetical protein
MSLFIAILKLLLRLRNVLTLCALDIFQFHVSIIYNLVFPFSTYSLVLNDYLKNENKIWLVFVYFMDFQLNFLAYYHKPQFCVVNFF